ncbi:MAG: serine dehydratase beta chain, partial [Pseudomonadota bacterium]
MYLSVFDIFKVGVGPSSSHTMGPMSAAADFVQLLSENAQDAHALEVRIYGSLALTGKGHATDRAIFLGLMGIRPDTIDADHAERLLSQLSCNKAILLPGGKRVRFRPDQDLIFEYDKLLPHHTNGMRFSAVYDQGGVVLEETYYSIGGGFVMTEAEMKRADAVESIEDVSNCPYPFETASEMLAMGDAAGLSIAEMKRANELSQQTPEVLSEGITRIWLVMDTCIERGLNQDGILPGGLHVRRRAKAIHEKLVAQKHANSTQPHAINDWISVYALAVNEENAAG